MREKRVGVMRSTEHRVIAGVCGGFAESMGWNPWVVRVAYATLTLMTALIPGVVMYVVFARLLPERRVDPAAEALGMFVDPDDPTGGYRL